MLSRAARGLLVIVFMGVLSAPALAHVERPSFWPDPAPDTSVDPPAGGAVPVARSLASALDERDDSTTRVVCQPDSLQKARDSIASMQTDGYVIRPSQGRLFISARRADRLLWINQQLFARCDYRNIQAAVTASGNNDRVVIMPGVYTEQPSRDVPTPDPGCAQYKDDVTAGGAVSYRYHFYCPNDANLIALNGRALGPQSDEHGPGATPPVTDDRHGIPNEGKCIRCNVQIEGSTDDPQDVVVEAGDPSAGNGGPSAVGHAKDVGIKVDRADGAVIRNLTVRHAREHDIYLMETDGYLLDRVKVYYAGEYGVLTFGVDHGVMQDSVGAGHGDAVLYPGGAPDTGAQRDTSWYPTWRYNQELRRNDMYHSNLGYSGTMGNAVHVVDNDIYGNTTGIATESFYAGGHPGYPQDSATFENNRIYSNNFNDYGDADDVTERTAVPVGTGIIIAGGNDDVVRNNQFWDNWRRAVMLVTVPTEFGCPIEGNNCSPKPAATNQLSNSFDNRFYGNRMGIAPDGSQKPNGVDFWWDDFAGTTGNCWYGNGAYTSDPPPSPVPGQSVPRFLPEDCATSVGTGDPAKEAELLACAGVTDFPSCTWADTPPRPGTAAARRFQLRTKRLAVAAARRPGLAFDAHCLDGGLIRSGLAELGCPGARAALADAIAGARDDAPPVAMQSKNCSDWTAAGPAARGAMIESLRRAATEPDPENPGATLTPAQATSLFDRTCAVAGTEHYVLYVLYNRAAAFWR